MPYRTKITTEIDPRRKQRLRADSSSEPFFNESDMDMLNAQISFVDLQTGDWNLQTEDCMKCVIKFCVFGEFLHHFQHTSQF